MIPQVNQVLWLAYTDQRRSGEGHLVRVVKVGRKWAEFVRFTENESESRLAHQVRRFNITDPRWPVDSGGHGWDSRIYTSGVAWENEQARDDAFVALRRVIDYGCGPRGPDVTSEDIRSAARSLGLLKAFEDELARRRAEKLTR